MSFAFQWSLNKTAGTVVSVARDVLLAANNDNVQPLAIMACEKFGNTVAMCDDTCRKIDSLTTKTPRPVTIHFIQAYIGFDSTDAATQLGRSQAGLQFLALAAALVTSMESAEGAKSLHKMLGSSASDKTFLPTIRQLKDLLQSLQPRLTQSGFLDMVAGWHIFLSHSPTIIEDKGYTLRSATSPTPEGIAGLVNAFRELARVGESDVTRVKIVCVDCAAWIIAFTKWCLGMPPSIHLENGRPVLIQPGSQVEIYIAGTEKSQLRLGITVYRAVGMLSELIQIQSGLQWQGMLNIAEHSRQSLLLLGLSTGTAKIALEEALPCALKLVLGHLRFDRDNEIPRFEGLESLRMNPFPEEHILFQTMSQYLGYSEDNATYLLDTPIEDLPAVQAHLSILQQTCGCTTCATSDTKTYRQCLIKSFYHNLAEVCADVLVLSLFADNSAFPLLHWDPSPQTNSRYYEAVRMIIRERQVGFCDINELLDMALRFIGHKTADSSDEWIMSSANGQVLYPRYLETLVYHREGYLKLGCLPGLLRYQNEVYSKVCFQDTGGSVLDSWEPDDLDVLSSHPVNKPRFLTPQFKLVWMVEQSNDALQVSLGLQGVEKCQVNRSPSGFFRRFSSALILETCEHDPHASLVSSDPSCLYTSPLKPCPVQNQPDHPRKIGVVAVDGSDQMRFLALASVSTGNIVVLRKQACLSCCLDVCKEARADVIVL